jgi:hypothetical protein
MKTGYCPKCGNTCGITFTRTVTKAGKTYYPQNGKKVFVIPDCKCSEKKAA